MLVLSVANICQPLRQEPVGEICAPSSLVGGRTWMLHSCCSSQGDLQDAELLPQAYENRLWISFGFMQALCGCVWMETCRPGNSSCSSLTTAHTGATNPPLHSPACLGADCARNSVLSRGGSLASHSAFLKTDCVREAAIRTLSSGGRGCEDPGRWTRLKSRYSRSERAFRVQQVSPEGSKSEKSIFWQANWAAEWRRVSVARCGC